MQVKGFGHLVDESFTSFREHMWLFTKISFIVYFLPSVLLGILTLEMPNFWTQRLFEVIRILLSTLLSLALTFIIIKVLLMKRTRKEISVAEAISEGMKHFSTGIFLSVVLFFALLGLTLLAIVPGIIFSIYWTFAYFALITDSKDIMESIHHSRRVVKGRWWLVCTYSFLLAMMLIGISFAVLVPVYFLIALYFYFTHNLFVSTTLIVIFGTLLEMFILPFSLIFMEKFYLNLKETLAKHKKG